MARNLQKLTIVLLFGFFVGPNLASATTIIPMVNSGGYFTGDVVWTKAGSPYVVTEAIFSGSSFLTIEPGTIVKFNQGRGIFVQGRLKVGSATSTEKVYFTSIKDDTVGGDTNNDATSTTPRAGDWSSFSFAGHDGVVDNTVFRYGGSGTFYAGELIVSGGQLFISQTKIADSRDVAILQTAGTLAVTDSDISNRCGGIKFFGGTLGITKSNLAVDYSLASVQCSIFALTGYVIYNIASTPIFATSNWWGSSSGPKHQLNPSGTGSAILGNADFTPWFTSNPLDVTTCTKDCFSNVLFLPGMMGSRLFEQGSDCGLLNGEKERWVSTLDCDHARLALLATGKSLNPLYTKEDNEGVIDDTYNFNIYQSFMNDLKKWKETDHLINDYSLVAYDWRLSLEDILQNGATTTGKLLYSTQQGFTNSYIYLKLKILADSSKTKKVTIVSHSNGGLVAKALIQKLKDSHDPLYDRIDNVIFVAVPQAGTPSAIGSILHGAGVGLKGLVISTERVRDLLHNMPTGYNLLPSRAYVGSATPLIEFGGNAVSPEILTRYGSTIDTYDKLADYLSGGDGRAFPAYPDLKHATIANPVLLSSAETAHSTLDQWTPATSTIVYEIAGWGVYTPAGIRYEKNKECIPADPSSTPQLIGVPQPIICTGYIDTIRIQDKVTLNGDGTVVDRSAHLMPTSTTTQKWWVDLGKYNKLRTTIDRKHNDIFEVEPLRAFIKSIIVKNIAKSTYITANPATLIQNGDYIKYQLHSPLNLNIYDQAGNHTGISTTTSLIEEGIKGSAYYTLGDTKIVIVPADTLHTVKLDAYASGSFTLDLGELHGDTVTASTTFEAIPTATTTQATLVWAGSLSPATTLAVDFNGDSTVDATLKPTLGGTTVYDITPPETHFTFDPASNKFVVTGIDNLSSTTVNTTTTSTTITDEAGNTTVIPFLEYKEESKEIKVAFDTIIYNGVATTTPKIILMYEWKFKNDILKSLSQEVHVKNTREIEAKYKQSTNETKIIDEVEGGESKKMKLSKSGIAVVNVTTDKGQLLVVY